MKPAERLAKLLALAMDQAGTPEGELARERADALMQRHGLDETDAAAMVTEMVPMPAATWRRHLLDAVCRLCCVSMAYGRQHAVVAGREPDVKVAIFFNEQVLRQMEEAFGDWLEFLGRPSPSRRIRRQWRESYVAGVRVKVAQIQASRSRAADKADTTAIADRSRAADDHLRVELNVRTAAQGLEVASRHGYHQGRSVVLRSGLDGVKREDRVTTTRATHGEAS